jgi:hypothetical protein
VEQGMNLEAFLVDEVDNEPYSDRVCTETRRRIRLAVAAYAYEIMHCPVMSDSEFDELAKSIDLTVDTRRPDLDKWFRKNFDPFTGMWIHGHPERQRIEQLAKFVIEKTGAQHEQRAW